jgi:transcriptional regulator with XRE-family HTH domain
LDELGSVLREAREARGLTLENATAETRIPKKYLQAMEEGRFRALPTPVHARGYLRNYAKYLGLDPNPLLESYEMQSDQVPAVPIFTPEPVRRVDPSADESAFFNPVNVEVSASGDDRRGVDSWMRIIIIVALVVAIALVASRFFLSNNDGERNEVDAGIVDTVAGLLQQDGEPTAIPLPNAGIVQGNLPITSTGRTGLDSVGETTTRPRPDLPPVMETIELILEITERTWLQVIIDGEVQFEGQARSGDTFDFTGENAALDSVQLTTGNAAGVYATINDIEIGRLGERGEVVDETWETTPPQ